MNMRFRSRSLLMLLVLAVFASACGTAAPQTAAPVSSTQAVQEPQSSPTAMPPTRMPPPRMPPPALPSETPAPTAIPTNMVSRVEACLLMGRSPDNVYDIGNLGIPFSGGQTSPTCSNCDKSQGVAEDLGRASLSFQAQPE